MEGRFLIEISWDEKCPDFWRKHLCKDERWSMLKIGEGFSFLRTEEKGVFVWGTGVPLDTLLTRCKYYTEGFVNDAQFSLWLCRSVLHNVQGWK